MNPYITYSKSVDVLVHEGWITFDTCKEAAEYLGVAQSTLSTALRKNKPCNGYQVRDNKSNT